MDNHISQAKEAINRGRDRILKTLAATPDDKLNWSPSSTSKSPIGIANHAAQTNLFFVKVILGEPIPPISSLEEADRMMQAASAGITTREQAVKGIDDSVSALLAALDKVTPEDLSKDVPLVFTTLPMGHVIVIPGMHMGNHAAQIDYIQTIWGDVQNHM